MTKDYSPTFSLRFSPAQRQKLDHDAGRLSMGEYIRQRLFGASEAGRRPYRRPLKDDLALGQVLAALGRSRLAGNVHQLARAVNRGELEVTPETEQALLLACSDIREMRECLTKALGLPAADRGALPDDIIRPTGEDDIPTPGEGDE